ncbi:MAG TPA: ATP-binding protein, partial [Ideonella sp.]|nr:ATP-binding protein [Ideonella sp.]
RSGGGVGVFFARYLFSIGLPVEHWLQLLAGLLRAEPSPERFLEEAAAALGRLPSVAGVAWRAGGFTGERGERTPHVVEFTNGELELQIHSRYRLSPALQWHLHLLGQLLGEFYVAKRREESLRETSYLKAVHETGARTTHDIKNLLQSLNVLCSVATGPDNRDSAQLAALVRRQLPMVAQRLAQTLERLQRPQAETETDIPSKLWWDAIAPQYQGERVEFLPARLPPESALPRSLFDSVADNLIRNALAKRAHEPELRVRVSLEQGAELVLRVCDSGSAVPPELAANLLRAPVASSGGLGIGLYQAALQAEAGGFRLALEKNVDGEVCFALYGKTPAPISLP